MRSLTLDFQSIEIINYIKKVIELDLNWKVLEFKQKKCDKDRTKLLPWEFIKNKYEKRKYICSLPSLKDEETSLNMCYDSIISNDFITIYPLVSFGLVNINKVPDRQ